MLDPFHTSGFSRLLGLSLCLSTFLVSACKLNEKASVAGGLVVAVDTDMSMPKDLDHVSVEVTQGTATLFMHEQMLAEGMSALPLEFEVKDAQDSVPVLVRAIGSKDGAPRIERSAITTVPSTYLGLVRLQLNYLCDGMVSAEGLSSCGANMTCVQGSCDTAAIANSLPDYYERDAAKSGDSTGMTSSATSMCFDLAKCFSNRTEMMPDTASGCSFESDKLFPTNLNVALQLDQGSAGVCDKSGCLIVLDSDGGFNLGNDGRVFLPKSICQLRDEGANIHVATSMQCPSKTQGTPLCRGDANKPSGSDPGKSITVGTSSPVGGACAGGGARACEMCGSQNRMCQSGLWSEFGMCSDQGVCVPNTIESCGANGTRTCGGDCTWGNCESQTCEGASTRACGNCGTQRRTCNNGTWTEWSACSGEGVCMPGSTQACGSGGTQACEGSCQWGACSMQVCMGAASGACGNCGTRERTCDSNTAQWSEWGACDGEGECRPDSTMACGRNGTQTCGGNCKWDVACTGQTCEGPARRSCGLCGTQIRTCDMTTGEYSDWSECFAEGECEPDSRTSCGSGGERTCGGNCRWGLACTGQTCDGPSMQPCGECGMQTRRCDTNSGTWSDWSSCLNEGDCAPGETRACGTQGTQTCNTSCRWGTVCPGQTCTGSATRPCANNPCGVQTRTCNTNTGNWNNDWSACSIPTAGCKPGSTQSCGMSKQETCANDCTWDAKSCKCTGGLSSCDGGATCIDLGNDPRHCGTCDTSCPAGYDCNSGKCACNAPNVLCNGKCMRLDTAGDPDNCGACGNVCAPDHPNCTAGKCTCPKGTTDCKGSCVNVASDESNCGACGKTCPAGRMCMGGNCACPPGTMDCDGTCINVKGSDKNNCGACGKACAAGQMCVGGTCETQCPMGETMCGSSACANLQTDAQNCGMCRNACSPGMTCQAGVCKCPAGTAQCPGSTACVSLNTSMHCGSCTTSCGTGMCTEGTCGCANGLEMCGNQCVDLKTTEAHCGSCTNSCPTGATCTGGTCVCPNGTKDCGGATCVNVMGNDEANCGACGKTCSTTCNNGTCGCGAGQHMCSTGCVARSAASCGAECARCPARENATASCSAADECEYKCDHASCGSQCCASGEVCMNGACREPTTTPPPTGGSGGPTTPPPPPPRGGSGGPTTPPPPPPRGGSGGPTTPPPPPPTGGSSSPTAGRGGGPRGGSSAPRPQGGRGGPTNPPTPRGGNGGGRLAAGAPA